MNCTNHFYILTVFLVLTNQQYVMKKLQLSFILCFASLTIFSQMRIIDPQNPWWGSYASIENVHIVVKPGGIFAETAITFDVKSSEGYFDNETQLEYVYDFNMPDNVVFNDSWLWIEDYISKGEIYEKSEGTAIYEAIVDRQQDPSILTKIDNDSYNFRIYPMFNDSTRRVRLSYLVPFENKDVTLETFLPLSFIQDSYERPKYVTLDIIDDDNWFHLPVNSTDWVQTNSAGNTTSYALSEQAPLSNTDVVFSSDTEEEYKLGIYELDGTKYFQLVYEPEIEQALTPTYNLILLDHETDNSNIDRGAVLSMLSDELEGLNEVDKFNILYHDFTPHFTSDDWQSAESASISEAINQISTANTTTFSWLATLLPQALSYAEEMGQKTKIIIISADNDFYEEESSDQFLTNVNNYISQMSTEVSLSVIDYSNYRPGMWIANQYLRGNEYLYSRLTQQHDGTYHISQSQGNMESAMEQTFEREIDLITEYDLDIENEFGFSFSRYFIGSSDHIRIDKPVMMTGKYVGEVPFQLEFNAFHNGEIIQDELTLIPNMELDATAAQAWAAQYILANENDNDQNSKNDVVDASMENRLLSQHTVFLCLEPDFIDISSNNGDDDDFSTVATEETEIEANILAFPNPFTDYINVEIPSDIVPNNEDLSIQVLSIDGKLVYSIDQKSTVTDGKILFKWTPEMNLDGGIYLIKIITEEGVRTIKVMLVR